jgi:anti-sigma B factor antagonist
MFNINKFEKNLKEFEMDFHIEKQQDKSVIVFETSKIMGTEAEGIQNAVLDLIEQGSKNIAVDLTNVDYITSYGIGMLIYAHTTCTKKEINFYAVGVNEKVMELLKLVHLDKIFKIQDVA